MRGAQVWIVGFLTAGKSPQTRVLDTIRSATKHASMVQKTMLVAQLAPLSGQEAVRVPAVRAGKAFPSGSKFLVVGQFAVAQPPLAAHVPVAST